MVAQRAQNRVEHKVQFLTHVLGKEAQHQITVLLQQLIFAPVAAVRDRIREMLGAIQLHRHAGVPAQQIDFETSHTVERDRQRHIDAETAFGLM